MNIADLLKDNKIDEREYMTYIMFGSYDVGTEYLKKIIEGTFLEDPTEMGHEHQFAWQDGRRSVWRDIKNAVNKVQYLLENS